MSTVYPVSVDELRELLTDDLTPPCDVGRTWPWNQGKRGPCPRDADYSLQVHDCTLTGQAQLIPAIWCDHHLNNARLGFEILLRLTGGNTCRRCGEHITSTDQIFRDITPLR